MKNLLSLVALTLSLSAFAQESLDCQETYWIQFDQTMGHLAESFRAERLQTVTRSQIMTGTVVSFFKWDIDVEAPSAAYKRNQEKIKLLKAHAMRTLTEKNAPSMSFKLNNIGSVGSNVVLTGIDKSGKATRVTGKTSKLEELSRTIWVHGFTVPYKDKPGTFKAQLGLTITCYP